MFIYIHLFSLFAQCTRVGIKWPKNNGKYDNGGYNYIVLARELHTNSIISKNEVNNTNEGIILQDDGNSVTPTYMKM